MSYIPTVWTDHITSGNCFNIYNNDDGTKEIVFAGQILQQGTPMSAENFNHMETGIENAFQIAEEAKSFAESNAANINDNSSKISANASELEKLQKVVNANTASVNYMAEHKANTATVTANTNAISALDTKVASVESEINNKLDVTSKAYIPIRYITGKKDFNTDFMLYSTDPDKVVFSNSDKVLQDNAPFDSFRYPYILTVEKMKYSDFEEDFDLRQTCVVVEYGGSDSVKFAEYQRIYKGLSALWTQWKESGQTADETLLSKITQNTNNISALDERVGDNETNIDEIQSAMTALKETVNKNTTNIGKNTNEISVLNSNVSNLQSGLSATVSRVNDLENEIDGLNSSVEYMSEHKANTIEVTANTNAISALDTRVASAESKITALGLTDTRHSDQITQNAMNIANNLAKIEANTNDITVTKDTLGYSQKNLIKKITSKTQTFYGVTFTVNSDNSITINGTATSNACDFYICGWWNNVTSFVLTNPGSYIVSFGDDFADSGMKGIIVTNGTWAMREFTTSETTWEVTDNVANTHMTCLMIRVPQGVTVDNLTVYPMIRYSFITDDTYEPYAESVNERFDRFTVQSLLYSDTIGGSSPLTVTVSNLFKKYSAVICNVVTSSDRYTQVLPLNYIKSLGTNTFYQAEQLLYYYVDDSNLKIYTGLGQSNPTINSITVIGLY